MSRRRRSHSPPAHAEEPSLLFRSGRERVLRAVNLVSVACALAAAWVIVVGLPAMTTNDGASAGAGEKLLLGLFLGAVGVLFLGGMALYSRRYVSEIRLETEDLLLVQFVGFFSRTTRRISVADIAGTRNHEGRFESWQAPSVNAPWISMGLVDGTRLILDLQAEVCRTDRIEGLVVRAARMRARRDPALKEAQHPPGPEARQER